MIEAGQAGNIRLLITDLDRTLLRSDKSISPYSQEVFRRCREYGLKTAIATARSEFTARKYIDLIQPDIVISNGGALVRVAEKIIYKSMLAADISEKLIRECLGSSAVGVITVETEEAYYRNNKREEWPDTHAVYNDFASPLKSETYKITVEIRERTAALALAAKFPECSMLEYTGESWVRFAHKHATKGRAVCALAKFLNLGLDEIAAFGDDYNDLEMLQLCGHGVAVANAIEEVRMAAGFSAGSNDDDGVAKYIEAYFFPMRDKRRQEDEAV